MQPYTIPHFNIITNYFNHQIKVLSGTILFAHGITLGFPVRILKGSSAQRPIHADSKMGQIIWYVLYADRQFEEYLYQNHTGKQKMERKTTHCGIPRYNPARMQPGYCLFSKFISKF